MADLPPIHPTIDSIEDALTFKIARFAAINARDGTVIFRDELGVTLNEWRVLGLVGAHQPLSFMRLADRLLMDKGQLSRTVRALTDRGLIWATPLNSDARQIDLTLSPEGVALHARGLDFVRARNEEVVAGMSIEEARTFHALLDRLIIANETLVARNGNL